MSNIKGYKVFNSDWTCRGFQYKVGETFKHNGNIEMCGSGFHFCQNASDCFNYYSFDSRNKVAEVEAIGLVKTQGNKSVTDTIKIVREIEWQELLTIVNEGNNCTGFCNSGHYNTGNHNSGHCNSNDWNSGHYNTGNYNSGNRNTGSFNTGRYNSGDWNSGSYNSGDWNSGSCNSGYCNSGNYNSGDWNSTNYSTGFFNTEHQPIYMFNKPTNMSRNDIYNLEGMQVLRYNFQSSNWIYSEKMSAEEKAEHPEHRITGGYLKTVDFKTACKMMWDKLDKEERQAVIELPNFDAKIFEDITGINVNEDN